VYGDGDGDGVPREVLVPELPADAPVLEQLLADLRGTRVSLRVPQRGDKRDLLQTVERNAQQAFQQHKLKRATDLTARSRALAEIQDALGLDSAPLRIECFDVSHVQGTNVVASMVVFEDGLARKSEYRRFAIRGTGPTDGATRADRPRTWSTVVTCSGSTRPCGAGWPATRPSGSRPAREAEDPTEEGVGPQGIDPETGRPRKFAYPPNLLVVDGGAPQVAAAADALAQLGIQDVALCGLAKRLEEVWLPGEEDPVILPRTSEGLYLLQRIRDEAHRFAITYHRQKRSKAMTTSALDGVPGWGRRGSGRC
jgi:excinuclease ABC subunit C